MDGDNGVRRDSREGCFYGVETGDSAADENLGAVEISAYAVVAPPRIILTVRWKDRDDIYINFVQRVDKSVRDWMDAENIKPI